MSSINKNNFAIVFPGQGSQFVGMGLDVISKYPQLHRLVDIGEAQTGIALKEVILSGDDRLHQTIYTQPAILLATLLLYEQVMTTCSIQPAVYSGFSLGEYAALYGSGIIDLKTTFRLISARSQAMHRATLNQQGAMAAIIGLASDKVDAICHQVATKTNFVGTANYNCPGQTVISGHRDAVSSAGKNCLEAGARRVILLNVSGAFHSPLMHGARLEFEDVLKTISFNQPTNTVFMNTTAKPLKFNELANNMANQIESPVLWQQTIEAFLASGITCVLEIGPGNVLAGLIRKTASEIDVFSYNKITDFDLLKGWLKEHELA